MPDDTSKHSAKDTAEDISEAFEKDADQTKRDAKEALDKAKSGFQNFSEKWTDNK